MAGAIVVGGFEVPGWGGLATATYRLFETMLAHGLDAWYVNLVRAEDRERFRGLLGSACENPRGLPRVHTAVLEAPLHEPQAGLAALLAELSPRPMVGAGDIAAYLMKRAAPRAPIVLLTGGCMQVDPAAPLTGFDWGRADPPAPDWKEREAVEMAELVLTHSDVVLRLYRHFYPRHARRIHPRVIWFAEWIHAEAREHAGAARPFGERDVDALFVASSWSRQEKACRLVAEVTERLAGSSVHVVGEAAEPIPGAEHHGVLGRAELFRLMGRARTVACPSSFDAAPGILFEASALGCNPVASRNCGNWEVCHEELLAEPWTADAFAQAIRRGRERKLPDRMDRFLASGSYRELTRVLLDETAWAPRAAPASPVGLAPALSCVVPHQRL